MMVIVVFILISYINVFCYGLSWVEMLATDDVEVLSLICNKDFNSISIDSVDETFIGRIPIAIDLDYKISSNYVWALRVSFGSYYHNAQILDSLWESNIPTSTAISVSNEMTALEIAIQRFEGLKQENIIHSDELNPMIDLIHSLNITLNIITSLCNMSDSFAESDINKDFIDNIIKQEDINDRTKMLLDDYIGETLIPLLSRPFSCIGNDESISMEIIMTQDCVYFGSDNYIKITDTDITSTIPYYGNDTKVILRQMFL